MRSRYSIQAALSSTSSEEKDLGNKKYEVVSDSLSEGGTWKTRLAPASVDVNLSLRDVAEVKLLVVSTLAVDPNATPGTVTLKLNATVNDPFDIVPLPTAKQGHFLLTTESLTSIFLSNPGAVEMEVTLTVAGD